MKRWFILLVTGLLFSITSYADRSLNSHFPLYNYSQQISDWINPSRPDYNRPISRGDELSWQTIQMNGFYSHYFGDNSPWDSGYIDDIYHHTKKKQNDPQTRNLKSTQLFNLKNKGNYLYEYSYDKDANLDQYTNTTKKVPGNSKDINLGYHGYKARSENFPDNWIVDIEANMNLCQFSDDQKYDASNRAIATDNLNARVLPTDDVYALDHTQAGEGYPFDYLQMSVIWAGTPVYILGISNDGQWYLVASPDVIAWVRREGVVRISENFIASWRAAAKNGLVAITSTAIPIVDEEEGKSRFKGYIGSVFPLEKKDASGFRILIPPANTDLTVETAHHANLVNQNAALMPLSPTPHHFVNIMSQLIGRPYRWGNLEFKNDCSGETKNFYVPFGIWLPRNSASQVDPSQGVLGTLDDYTKNNDVVTTAGQRINHLTENSLNANDHRFTTIVNIGGHVFMYVGTYHNPKAPNRHAQPVALTYQNVWGLRPVSGDDKRFLIKKAVLLPLLSEYPEDKNISSLAGKSVFQIMHLDMPVVTASSASSFVLFNTMLRTREIDLRALMVPEETD